VIDAVSCATADHVQKRTNAPRPTTKREGFIYASSAHERWDSNPRMIGKSPIKTL